MPSRVVREGLITSKRVGRLSIVEDPQAPGGRRKGFACVKCGARMNDMSRPLCTRVDEKDSE